MTDSIQKEAEEMNNKLQSELCEIMPSVCEDSGQAEWSHGELQKMIDAFMEITEYWSYRKDLLRREDRIKELEDFNNMLVNKHFYERQEKEIKHLQSLLSQCENVLEPFADLAEKNNGENWLKNTSDKALEDAKALLSELKKLKGD